jgi:hypothetical protein
MEKIVQLLKLSCAYLYSFNPFNFIDKKKFYLISILIKSVNSKGRNYVIKREITKDSHSEWYLNGKNVKLKEVSFRKVFFF